MLKSTEIYLLSSVQVISLTEDATPEIANSVKRLLSLKVQSGNRPMCYIGMYTDCSFPVI